MTERFPSTDKANLAQRLPLDLQEQLAQQVRHYDRITGILVQKFDREHDICETYHVNHNQFQRYLKRLQNRSSNQNKPKTAKDASIEKQSGEQLQARRERQAEIADVLQKIFGNFADLKPELWSHRAFLMLMGLVYEKLSSNEHELSTDELVKLTKALGDACRVQPQSKQDKKTTPEQGNKKTDPLPKNFAEIVRHVYGTNFSETEKTKPATTLNQGSDREGAGR